MEYSVALCTYNGSRYIGEQLKSIINQSVKPSQIIVSDDGSKDNTLDVVESLLSNSGIDYSVLLNKGEHGVTGNFQNAISHCSYPIVFTSDQDDVWQVDKARLMLEVFDSNPEALLVFSDGELVDSEMNLLGCSVWHAAGLTDARLNEYDWFHFLLKNNLITGAAMAFRRSLFTQINVIPKDWLHDGWLGWCAVANNGLFPCNHKLFYYRQHGGNVVGMSPSNSILFHIKKYIRNFKIIKENRRIRYSRYKSLVDLMGDKFSESQLGEINQCVQFWKKQTELSNYGVFKRLSIITSQYFHGFYHKYYNGTVGYIRDFIIEL